MTHHPTMEDDVCQTRNQMYSKDAYCKTSFYPGSHRESLPITSDSCSWERFTNSPPPIPPFAGMSSAFYETWKSLQRDPSFNSIQFVVWKIGGKCHHQTSSNPQTERWGKKSKIKLFVRLQRSFSTLQLRFYTHTTYNFQLQNALLSTIVCCDDCCSNRRKSSLTQYTAAVRWE